jgi:hypothetical protein
LYTTLYTCPDDKGVGADGTDEVNDDDDEDDEDLDDDDTDSSFKVLLLDVGPPSTDKQLAAVRFISGELSMYLITILSLL